MQHSNSKKARIIFETLGLIIKEERVKQGKSQRVLAYEFDIQKSMLSRIENAINEPKLISIMTICEALGIKPSELFKRLEEKLPEDFSLIES